MAHRRPEDVDDLRRVSEAITIAIILPDLGGGGAQRVMLQVAGGLDLARFRPHILVLGGSQQFADQVPPHLPIEIGKTDRLRDGLPWLIRRLRALRPRLAVSVMGYLNLALLACRPLLPRQTSIIVREANVLAATENALPRWLPARTLYRQLYPRAAAIVAPSGRIAAEISGCAPAAARRIAVIANPVDVEALRRRASPPKRVPGPGLRLVAAGRLTRQKGFDRLLSAMPALEPMVRLSIFGSGPDEDALRMEIAARGLAEQVRLEGFSTELPATIAGADALLLPSRWEGLPNVVLESLALGTPVIASDEAAVQEVGRAAPPGAVIVGSPELEFLPAIRGLKPQAEVGSAPRVSLLPAVYHQDTVISQWSALIERLVAREQAQTS